LFKATDGTFVTGIAKKIPLKVPGKRWINATIVTFMGLPKFGKESTRKKSQVLGS